MIRQKIHSRNKPKNNIASFTLGILFLNTETDIGVRRSRDRLSSANAAQSYNRIYRRAKMTKCTVSTNRTGNIDFYLK